MNWKRCRRKRPWPNLRYSPVICLEGLRKNTKNLSQDSRCPGRDLNLGPPEYEAGVLTTRPRRSVAWREWSFFGIMIGMDKGVYICSMLDKDRGIYIASTLGLDRGVSVSCIMGIDIWVCLHR
jgi:hypothetical protein